MKLLFLLLLLTPLYAFSDSPDFTHRFGISAGAGWGIPILGNDFDDRADGEFVSGLYGRYQFSRDSGIQLGYTRYELSQSPTAPRIYDLVYMNRLAPYRWLTPIWGAGIGLVDIANYNIDENLKLGLKARIGAEVSLDDNLICDFVLDYQYVGKMPGERRDLEGVEMNILAPQAILSYFFK